MEYRFGPYRLLPVTRELRLDDTPVPTTRLLFDLIGYLVEHRDRAVGRDELVGAVWGRVDVADARVSELVMRARRAVGDDGQEQAAIRTITGFGYRWVAATVAEPAAPVRTAQAFVDARPAEPADPESTQPAARPRRRLQGAIGLALALAALAATWIGLRTEPRPGAAVELTSANSPTLAVLPLSVDGPNEVQWIRFGAMDLVANRLREGGLAVAPSESVVALTRAQTSGSGSAATLQQALGAGRIVRGSAARRERQWKVELATESTDGVALTVQAERTDAIEAAQQAADMLLAALGRTPPIPAANERSDLESRLQQAQSALLANQLDTARAILDAAPESDRADPRLRYRLATIDMMGGRLQAAANALDALAMLPEVRAQPGLYSRVLTTRGRVHFRARAFAQAERDFDAAAAALAQDSATAEAAQALSGRGIARVALHRFDEAAADLGRARLAFEAIGDTLGKARVDANFGMLEAERGRPEQALPYLLEAATRFEDYGVAEQAASILVGAYDAQAALLRWPDALATADRQWAMRERIGDPGIGLLVAVNRANALAALGRLREADAALEEAERAYSTADAQILRFVHAERAHLAWREKRAEDALAAAEKALAAWPADADGRAGLVLLWQRALISAGQASAARIESAWPATDGKQTAAPEAAVARAEWAARQGDAAAADQEFRAGLSAAEADGVPSPIAEASQAYASWLLTTGRVEDARAVAGRVAPWAERDFDCALLQLRVLRAGDAASGWEQALRVATRLAGERAIPPELSAPAVSPSDSGRR